ncbi:MAG: M14 family metallopeptidase [Lachnospiraceae bacterium]|nr:M14 family metallopeptidase [Lachnospiraceae bacterium]
MYIKDLYTVESLYRENMVVKGYQFGKGDKAACIIGSLRGNELQQMYICSQLVRKLKELEANDCISSGKEILVVPVVNAYSMNVGKRFYGVEQTDLNRTFPGSSYGTSTARLTDAVLQQIKDYSYGIQFTSFYMQGEFVPHVRMMETGYQNTSLANLFGLPYVVVRKPKPIDTKTLNFNWQDEMTAAFSVYSNRSDEIDENAARQVVAAVLRFLTRMGILHYESHSGYISHVIKEEDLTDIHARKGGFFRPFVKAGEEVRYNQECAEIVDPYEGEILERIVAPTDGIIFFAHTNPLASENEILFRLIHRLHE